MTVKAKKVLSVLSGIVIALFLILAVACLFVSISYKIQGEDGELFGRQFRIVTSGSMEPEIATGAIVCIDTESEYERYLEVLSSLEGGEPDKGRKKKDGEGENVISFPFGK